MLLRAESVYGASEGMDEDDTCDCTAAWASCTAASKRRGGKAKAKTTPQVTAMSD